MCDRIECLANKIADSGVFYGEGEDTKVCCDTPALMSLLREYDESPNCMRDECHGILDMYIIYLDESERFGENDGTSDHRVFISRNMILGPIGYDLIQMIAIRLNRWEKFGDGDTGHGYILPNKGDGCPQCGDTRKHYHRETPDGEETIYG